jgi:hypothetical protein
MDYRALLKKYMYHVAASEGSYFAFQADPGSYAKNDRLTEADVTAFRELMAEIDAEYFSAGRSEQPEYPPAP